MSICNTNKPEQRDAEVAKRWSRCAILGSAVLAFLLPQCANASTATASIAVSATVLSSCTIAASALAFGNYTSVLLTGTTNLTVACTAGTAYNVGLDVGLGTGATVAARVMTFGVATLTYGLFSNTARTTVWGPTIGTNTVVGAGTGLPQVLPVYGQIPAGQLAAPGLYGDTVPATITY